MAETQVAGQATSQGGFMRKIKSIGPGALVAAGFIGPGTVTTCTVSGASYGYTMLWCLLFATVATIIFQEMASRIGIVSRKGLGENIRDRITHNALKWIAIVIVLVAIFVGNIAYETGNITGGILGIQAVAPDIPMIPIVIVIGILAFIAMWIGNYRVVEVILTAIVVFMGIVFLITAFASHPDWGAVINGLFVPRLPENDTKGILAAVGLIGTTIVPYNLFLHASSAAERFKDPDQISDARFDTILSIGLGGIISMAIVICAAANIFGTGVEVTNGKDMAIALQPLMGSWATWMIGLGLLAAGFSSTITASLSAAYAVNGVLGWKKTLKDLRFKIIWIIVLFCGCFMAVALGKSPTELILVAQAANAILLPVMAFFVIYCANGKDLGNFRNHAFANIAGIIIIIITLFICWRNLSSFLVSLQTLIGG
ncbi:MAG: Nramp family divalent metal transporter [Eggerthellaceae bacterium]|jgi:manganese transport protein